MVWILALVALLVAPELQDPPRPADLMVQLPGAAARDRCARRSATEPRQSLEMRCRISGGRAEGDCEVVNATSTTSRQNIAAAQCILRATRWFHRDGSPANDVTMTQTYTLGNR